MLALPSLPHRCRAAARRCRSCIQEMRVVENRRELLSLMEQSITWSESTAEESTADIIAMEITDIVDTE